MSEEAIKAARKAVMKAAHERNALYKKYGVDNDCSLVNSLQCRIAELEAANQCSPQITNNDQLEAGKYYHCFEKRGGKYHLHQCHETEGRLYLTRNRYWAYEGNSQALERFDIFGPVVLPAPPDRGKV